MLGSPHNIPSGCGATTCLRSEEEEEEGGDSGGDWAKRHCSIKSREGFFLGSNERTERMVTFLKSFFLN